MDLLEIAISRPQGVSGPLLDLVARRIRANPDAELSRFGFRPLHLITMMLLDVSGEHTPSDLAEYLRIDRNTMASLLIELEIKDLIVPRVDRQDPRRYDSVPGSGGLRIWRGSRVVINESC
jgi:MarR family transcriptional regulator, transcriptional regulator for hemolysin